MQTGTVRSFRARQSRRRSRPNWKSFKGHASRRNAANDLAYAKGIYERYMTLARHAALTGDTIEAENCRQHAEHYFKLMNEQTV